MDYMMELASHPDMPRALEALRHRWQPLFEGAKNAVSESDKEFEPRYVATRQLVEKDYNGRGVQYLIADHPNVWIAQAVYEFYKHPDLAADAWLELQYCATFRTKLANRVIAKADERWRSREEAHRQAQRTADEILTPIKAAGPVDDPGDRKRVEAVSKSVGLVHDPPPFIKNLIEKVMSPDGERLTSPDEKATRFQRTDVAALVKAYRSLADDTQRAYRLLANPQEVRFLAETFSVPVPFSIVLQRELDQIRQTRQWVCARPDGERTTSIPREPEDGDDSKQGASFRQAFREDLLGLAFSGGGIRSATFNLGVLQSLAKIGLLKHCDYLSTVSGGGYIGGWFTAWMHRLSLTNSGSHTIHEMQRRLSPVRNANPVADAVRPVRYLREYSNYLTPRTGFLSADTWTMIGIFTRNALLNQVILVSLFAGVLLLPRVIVKIASVGAGASSGWIPWLLLAVIVTLITLATIILIKNLRRLDPLGSENRDDRPAAMTKAVEPDVPKYARPYVIQFVVVLPWLLALSLLVLRFPDIAPILTTSQLASAANAIGRPLLLSAVVAVFWAIYIALLLSFGRASRCWNSDWLALTRAFVSATIVGGLTAGAVTFAVLNLFELGGLDRGIARPWHAAILGGPVAMLVVSLSIVVVLGMLGEKFPDEHREWWSRLRTFIHMYALGCLAWFALALYVPWGWRALEAANWSGWSGWGAFLAWAGSTFAGVKAGASEQKKNGDAPPSLTATAIRGVAFVAPYVFVIGLMVLIALVIDVVVHHDNRGQEYWNYVTTWNETGTWVWWLTLGCFVVGIIFSSRVDINAFSMHHFYKNRLVRCYLGASHEDRKADWFTGFDPDDDLRLARLDHDNCNGDRKYPGPYPIVNCALNLVGGKDLAWQERKAESFVFTPKYCGFDLDHAVLTKSATGYAEAYAPTLSFYREGEGPLLGMAMAISGAAANPNMGQATSPASAFLLTVFNARLGWWVGNTRNRTSISRPGPPFGLTYTIAELTGSTDDETKYVNVSDGGHFDNLGVYELIRRGCRYIIACDAGQDGEFTFQDLGALVRKCRTDFGVEIDISLDRIRNRDQRKWSDVHCVVGTLHYLNIPRRDWRGQLLNEDDLPLRPGDRPAHEVGYLIYLKPSITGDEPHDVLEYGLRVPEFPHESTADQWFGESQFEAYRRLGMHIGECAFSRFLNDDRQSVYDIGWLFERLHKFWYPPTQAIGQHSTDHTRVYSTIMERVRTLPQLGLLDHTLFDGLPVSPPVPAAGTNPPQLDPRDEFYVINSLIQLMEDVYADLHLENHYDHPHVEGWMAVFRRWATQDAFKRTWAISRCTYAERFRRFYDDRLMVRRERRPLSFPTNFIASHRGRVNGGNGGNTLNDFWNAIDANADVIELDVRQLHDQTLVVFHDHEIQGHALTTLDHAAFLRQEGGRTVPTLAQCLTELRGKRSLDIELKDPGSVPKVLAEIRQTAWNTEDFVLTSFHPDIPSQIKAMREDVQVGLLLEQHQFGSELSRALKCNDVDFIAPEDGTALTRELLETCAERGVPVVPWTVNTEDRIRYLFKHPAVAGIITDHVTTACKVRRSVR